jgi:hypothetical protein
MFNDFLIPFIEFFAAKKHKKSPKNMARTPIFERNFIIRPRVVPATLPKL